MYLSVFKICVPVSLFSRSVYLYICTCVSVALCRRQEHLLLVSQLRAGNQEEFLGGNFLLKPERKLPKGPDLSNSEGGPNPLSRKKTHRCLSLSRRLSIWLVLLSQNQNCIHCTDSHLRASGLYFCIWKNSCHSWPPWTQWEEQRNVCLEVPPTYNYSLAWKAESETEPHWAWWDLQCHDPLETVFDNHAD